MRATYRLQFHRGFTFADAEAIVPYLAALGISHLYASPITVAQPGSTHGYDVVDPTRINPELGGEPGLRRLCAALKAHGLGLIVDIVPNHMGVAGSANRWWQDVLKHGRDSPYARFFDINWDEKILLPFLGAPLAEAIASDALALKRDEDGLAVWAYGTHRFPLRPEDQECEGEPLEALLARQHYRLAWWRAANDDLHWRRFFTITELAGLRAEDPQVFEAIHALYFRLYEEGLIQGVRVDHVDGLTDPAAYCRRLRERLGDAAWIVLEKILAPGEPLPPDWPVDGTSGYDFMEQVSALLHAPDGAAPLGRHWAELSGRSADFHDEELQARRDMLSWEFEGQLKACVAAFARLAASAPETQACTEGMLRRALRVLLWVFPVYRTYGPHAPPTDAAIRAEARARAAAHAPPGEMAVVDAVLAWLAGEGPGDAGLAFEAVRRFQQLSAPIAAKAVEDTAFYRYGRLLSRNDVGFDPARFAMPADDFHAAMAQRARDWPRAMLATATHDHKRGEDVRARLAALSELPDAWIAATRRWRGLGLAEGVDRADEYLLHQILFGAWPIDAERAWAWMEKALREAKLRSSWTEPDAAYEARCRALIGRLLEEARFREDMEAFVDRLRPAAEANALVQAFLRCTAPGVPDLYQGCEFQDLSLVDPDNRRPVDFAARARTLAEGGEGFDAVKQRLIADLLRLRAGPPELFAHGSWEPLRATGPRAGHILAFARRHDGRTLTAACAIRIAAACVDAGAATPRSDWWQGSLLPDGRPAAEAFSALPLWWEMA